MILNKIFSWVTSLFNLDNYTLRNFSVFLLILMCIQYIPIETRAGASWLKVSTMVITAFVMLRHMVVNKAFIIGIIYMLWIMLTAYVFHPATFRATTVIYLFLFVITYVAFYTFVWNKHVLELPFFIKFLKNFIFVLVVVLILQQCCLIVGIKLIPILNLCQILDRGIGGNSLTFEPSTFGRLLNVLFFVYLKCNEYRLGRSVKITELFQVEHRWVTIAYLWAMLTMGSGTAFIAMAITALYFMKGVYIMLALPMFVGIYFTLDYYGNSSFQRAVAASEATLTGNTDVVMETDGSAATRIMPMLNTLNLDLSDPDTWTGKGCDSKRANDHYSKKSYMGQINDYGLMSYLIELVLIFSCSIHFLSLPTLMFFTGVGGSIGNISYAWGLLMIFTCLRYFHDNYTPNTVKENLI